jgi:cysteine synthase
MDSMNTTTIDRSLNDRDWRDWALVQLEAGMAQAGKGGRVRVLPWPDPRVELDLVLLDATGGPTGSLKDWYVRDLFFDAILRRRLRRGMLAVDATSGSTGIAEAYWARLLGLQFIAVMPAHITPAKQELIREQGGECHLVSGPGTITEEAEALARSLHGHYIGQFPQVVPTPDWHGANSLTAIAEREMSRLRHPVPTWAVVPAGTGRTLTLFALSAAAHHRPTRICVADFADSALCRAWPTGDRSVTGEPSVIEGDARQQIEAGFDFNLIDAVVPVTDGESFAMTSFLEELTGRRLGGTTGRVMHGALAKLVEMRSGGEQGSVLVVGGDDGERYLDTLYSEDWRAQHATGTREAKERLGHLISYFNVGGLTGR